MSEWIERKALRREHYRKYVEGWKQVPCLACNGSGRYDHNGSPRCASCGGTGKERVPPGSPRLNGHWPSNISTAD